MSAYADARRTAPGFPPARANANHSVAAALPIPSRKRQDERTAHSVQREAEDVLYTKSVLRSGLRSVSHSTWLPVRAVYWPTREAGWASFTIRASRGAGRWAIEGGLCKQLGRARVGSHLGHA